MGNIIRNKLYECHDEIVDDVGAYHIFVSTCIQPALNLIGYNALRKDNDRKDAVTNRQREN